jgi:hypothetical protein
MVVNPTHTERTRADFIWIALIFAALVVRIILSPPIWHHGEAREGLVVQSIVYDHQWILPFRNGELPSKPPLFHWIAAFSSLPFGLSDLTVRLSSAIAAQIMVIATFLMGRAMGSRKTAWLAVGALLGMHEFWDSGTQARVDMVFSTCIVVSVAGFFLWYRDGRRIARATCYIAAALAVLAKGPAGLAFPVLVICGFLAVEGRLQLFWKFWSWPLLGLVFLIDVGWYGLAYHIGGSEFVDFQFFHENVDRFLGTNRFSNKGTHLDTVVWLATRTLPWNLVLLWSLIRRLRGEREDSAGRFLHIWWFSIFIVFALAARGRAVYLLPLYPAIALLAARAIGALLPNLAGPSRSDSIQTASPSASRSRRPLQMAKRVGIGIALFDLGFMLVNPKIWTDMQSRNARLTFIEKVAATVPSQSALFATPDFRGTELIVTAYRLRRDIDRKLITSANQNDYFLSPTESVVLTGSGMRILAVSEIDKVALVTASPVSPPSKDGVK